MKNILNPQSPLLKGENLNVKIMYINQAPPEPATEPEIKKKRSKAGFFVFLANLFLMAVAFLMIKNQNENKISSQEDSSLNSVEASVKEDATATANETAPIRENNQAQEPVLSESSATGTGSTEPVAVSKNTGVSATSPQANVVSGNSAVSSTVPQATSQKSTKTKTS